MAAALTTLLVACACSAPTPPLGEDTRLPPPDAVLPGLACSPAQDEPVDVDSTGPESETPLEAAEALTDDYDFVKVAKLGDEVKVVGYDPRDSSPMVVYTVRENRQGWYADSYQSCN